MKRILIAAVVACLACNSCRRGVKIEVKNIQTNKYRYEYTLKSNSSLEDEAMRQLIFNKEEDLFVETLWRSTSKVLSNKDIFNIEEKNGKQ